MSLVLPRLLVSALVLLGAHDSYATCADKDPALVAKSFHENHTVFHLDSPSNLKSIISSRLYSALSREYKCSRNELCAVEADPWTDAQDGEITKPIRFKTTQKTDTAAAVRMSYTFSLSDNRQWQQSVLVRLERNSVQGCWLISDLVSPKGQSLVGHIENWHQRFGNGL
ncbi:hypothetical protein [Azonexus sp. IMCC34839]|uniref:hypothetical protein n=1 Tax=Azonexus sp. IMCC34839 TaxID=3133695 RepID=UPI0039995E48